MRRALTYFLLAFVPAYAVAAVLTWYAIERIHQDQCRHALAAEVSGLRSGLSAYRADPAPCRAFSRAQQRTWLLHDLAP